MAVPGRVEAAALLLSLEPPEWHVRHSRAVAEVAAFLAQRIADRTAGQLRDRRPGNVATARGGDVASGTEASPGGRSGGALVAAPIDADLVATAALLHDADKALGPDDPAKRLRHGDGSAAWLARRGYPELGPFVAAHPVTRLDDEVWFRDVLLPAPIGVRIVAYADKRAGQRLESMKDRFASWEQRYPPRDGSSRGTAASGWDRATLEAVRERARELEASVCEAAGLRPEDVRRLRWTDAAFEAARSVNATRVGRDAAASGR